MKKKRTEKERHLSKRGIPEGRPRTTSPDNETLHKLGQEMITWLELNPNAYGVRQWSIRHKKYRIAEWEDMIQIEAFRGYYEQAQQIIAQRMADGTICPSIAHRYIGIVDREVYDHEINKSKEQAKAETLGKLEAANEQGINLSAEDLQSIKGKIFGNFQ